MPGEWLQGILIHKETELMGNKSGAAAAAAAPLLLLMPSTLNIL
jgi:hypothetical protein